jgi:1-acyl-sn-glycerol-3-phosphate acyltransferase
MKLFCSFEIIGIDNLAKSKRGVIIASNHISELDPMLISCCLPYFSCHLPLYYVSRVKDFYKNNKFSFLYGGEFFRLMGAYPAYAGLKDYRQALHHHIALLNQNKDVVIFPMGKKYTQNDPTGARGGVAFLAKETQSPIVPVLIQGIENFSFRAFLSRKRKLTITFGKPLNTDDIFITQNDTTIDSTRNEYEKASSILMKKIFQLA